MTPLPRSSRSPVPRARRACIVLAALLLVGHAAAPRGLALTGNPRVQPLIRDSRVQAWLQTHRSDARINAIRELAGRLSLGQLTAIHAGGGIATFASKLGCPHQCKGCLVNGPLRRPRSGSWTDFVSIVDGMLGLEDLLRDVGMGPSKLELIRRPMATTPDSPCRSNLNPFFDSEPMVSALVDSDGSVRDARDIMRHLHKRTGNPSTLVTSGWDPNPAGYQEQAARALVADTLAGTASYLGSVNLQIKTVTRPFLSDAVRHMRRVVERALETDRAFREGCAEDYARFGLDFSKYRLADEARAYYHRLALLEAPALLTSSPYLAARVENLKTLAPVLARRRSPVVLYEASSSSAASLPEAERPFVTGDFRRALDLVLRAAVPEYPGSVHRPWQFHPTTTAKQPLPHRAELGAPHLDLTTNTIQFTGWPSGTLGPGLPDLTRMDDPQLADLHHKLIFRGKTGTQPTWQRLGARIDGARDGDFSLSSREKSYLGALVRYLVRQQGGTDAGLELGERAELLRSGSRTWAVVPVKDGSGRTTYYLDLRAGRLAPASQINAEAAP